MAVDSTERRVVYAGNGKTTAFPFVFKVFADTDVVVSVGKPDGAEAAATLKINSDYIPLRSTPTRIRHRAEL